MKAKTVDFFLCATMANDFFSLCAPFDEPKSGVRRYLIKGSAGNGKSTAMKQAAEACEPFDSLIERIHCSSDPDSLDGVIFKDAKCSIVDATPPHPVEPKFPGSFQTIVNFFDALNEEILAPKLPALKTLSEEISLCHQKARRLMAGADALLSDNRQFIASILKPQKIDALADRLALRELPAKKGGTGEIHLRLLSAVTLDGIHTYTDTVKTMCSRVICIDDPFGVAADRLLRRLLFHVKQRGIEAYVCFDPTAPDKLVSHLLIPSLSLGFVTQSADVRFDPAMCTRMIRYTRFLDRSALRRRRQTLTFQKKAANVLIHAASAHLRQAKAIHDTLEAEYHEGVDFAVVKQKTEALCEAVKARYSR